VRGLQAHGDGARDVAGRRRVHDHLRQLGNGETVGRGHGPETLQGACHQIPVVQGQLHLLVCAPGHYARGVGEHHRHQPCGCRRRVDRDVGKRLVHKRQRADVVGMRVSDQHAGRLDLLQHCQVGEPVAGIHTDSGVDQHGAPTEVDEHAGRAYARSAAQEPDPLPRSAARASSFTHRAQMLSVWPGLGPEFQPRVRTATFCVGWSAEQAARSCRSCVMWYTVGSLRVGAQGVDSLPPDPGLHNTNPAATLRVGPIDLAEPARRTGRQRDRHR
jgi:hypothetical protein